MEQPSLGQLIQKNQQQNYNWIGVLEFLHEQHKGLAYKESEWALEKSEMQSKIKELEGVIAGLEKVVTDLGRRAKMLEVALRQERLKNQKQGIPDMVGQLLSHDETQLPAIPKRKARPYRPLLQKILSEVGIQQIFSPPGSPRVDNSGSNRPSAVLQTPIGNQSESPTQRENLNSTSGFPTLKRNEEQSEPLKALSQLRNHLDGVRDGFFFQNIPVMATVSEDCQVKLWDQRDQNLQPYLSLREHTGPIFAVAGIEIAKQKQILDNPYIVFSGGSEGVIKGWNVPLDIEQNGGTEVYQKCINSWNAHDDAIYQLEVNPYENLLLSSGADGLIKLWQITESLVQECIYLNLNIQWFMAREVNMDTILIFQQEQHGLDLIIIVLDVVMQTQGTCTSSIAKRVNYKTTQSLIWVTITKLISKLSGNDIKNRILSSQSQQILYTGHEDGSVKVFDLNANKQQNSFNAHQQPVTGICMNNSESVLYTVSHDSMIKAWDIRKQQLLQDMKIHNPKYDESIHNMIHHPNTNLLATCGADGIVQLFQTKN